MRFLYADFFFGGVPSSVDAAASMSQSFVGCISDVTFNGKIVNFAQLTDAPGATIGRCSGPAVTGLKPPKRNNTSKIIYVLRVTTSVNNNRTFGRSVGGGAAGIALLTGTNS